ncbi:copper resistance CopC family protein [Nonomuraea sp. SYSU D8015]|uniref:copper resistance CopC family protein n=1 Tax=Nonomuraea sp. SYSU D8015 TaxID=2593644 RepID=UPI001CB73FCA|nr:copper resistance CopC family protein [Nonomuraea sp. SYSU D8015]
MRRLLTVLLLACAAVGIAPPPGAQAHNVLIGSDPKDGAVLAASPARVTLVFDQAVRQGYAQVEVTGADGSAWADGGAVVAAERVSVKVKPLRAGGAYVVGYRILSADGHPVTGKITFSLAADASGVTAGEAAQGSSAEAAEAAANGGAGMAVVWIVGALLLLAGGTAVALRRSTPASPATAVTSAPAPDTDPAPTPDPAGPRSGTALSTAGGPVTMAGPPSASDTTARHGGGGTATPVATGAPAMTHDLRTAPHSAGTRDAGIGHGGAAGASGGRAAEDEAPGHAGAFDEVTGVPRSEAEGARS